MHANRTTQYVVVPYRMANGGLIAGQVRQASTNIGAINLAQAMADKAAGIAAYEVIIDTETGEMDAPCILWKCGDVPELD